MNCYRQIALFPKDVSHILNNYVNNNSLEFYKNIRGMQVDDIPHVERAARFISQIKQHLMVFIALIKKVY